MTVIPSTPKNRDMTLFHFPRAAVYAALLSGILGSCGFRADKAPKPDWSDEFNGNAYDTTVWSTCSRQSGPGWSAHMSALDSLYAVKDGCLELRAIVNPGIPGDTAVLLTGGLTSKGKKAFGYGRIEIRAKLEGTGGGWPALWMMPEGKPERREDDTVWVNFPKYVDYAEFDISERLNFDAFTHQTIHSSYTLTVGDKFQARQAKPPIHPDDFNIFALEHYKDSVKFFVNDVNTFTYRRMTEGPDGEYIPAKAQWPFDKKFYLILSMQVGGAWPGAPVLSDLPSSMWIDYIRFYAFKEE